MLPHLLLSVTLESGAAKDRNTLSTPRIVGGKTATQGRYPYMASMADFGAHKCGGTLIAPDVVMTAAHCVGFFNEVQVGQYSLSSDGNNDDGSQQEQHEIYLIQETARHPRYYANSAAEDDPHDLALIKIYGESQLQPIRVNRDPNIPTNLGDELVVTGWGTTDVLDASSVADTLQEAKLGYIPNDICRTITGKINGANVTLEGLVIDVTLCAIDFVNGQDSCNGDSGGPILIAGNNASEDVQVGITSSSSDGCASAIFPGVYARTSEVSSWLTENLCRISNKPPLDFECPDVPRLPVISEDEISITIEIDYDIFPAELGWILQSTNQYGVNVTYASRPISTYSDLPHSSTLSENVTLPNNQAYTFLLLDQRENGMCCGLGGLRIYHGVAVQQIIELYVSEASDSLLNYAVLSFDFTIGGLPTTAPTMSPAPSNTILPSFVPSVTRPYVSIELIFDEYSAETGWQLEAVRKDEDILIDVRYPGFYEKFLKGDRVVDEVNLLPISGSGPTQYRFTVTDNEGDGICCGYGEGIARLYEGQADVENLLFESTEFVLEQAFIFNDYDILNITTAPTTNLLATVAPATGAPITAAPITVAPITAAPITTAPITTAPATMAPATVVPASAAPATTAPVTGAPATAAPATASPISAPPATGPPITIAPISAAPATTAPITTSPATIAPATIAPATVPPVSIIAPATASPVSIAPVTGAPTTASPVTSIPTTTAPVTVSPITDIPTTGTPTTAPITLVPLTNAPASPTPVVTSLDTDAPVTVDPSAAPDPTFSPTDIYTFPPTLLLTTSTGCRVLLSGCSIVWTVVVILL